MAIMEWDKNVAVIGGGSWGTTLAHLMGLNGYKVYLWLRSEERAEEINTKHTNSKYTGEDYKLSENLIATTDIEKVIKTCPTIFLMVTSASARDVLHKMGDHLTGSHLIIHGIKGFEHSTFKRISTLIREETCCRKIGVLSGPNLAKEIRQGHPSATVVASKFEEVVAQAQKVLSCPVLRVYGNKDVIGCEIAGAFKNIIALGSGMSNGLGFGDNTKSLLLTRGIVEMTVFGMSLGAQATTFRGLAGMGDLMATCASPLSRNYQVGFKIAKGGNLSDVLDTMTYVSEGVPTTKSVTRYAIENDVELPITFGINSILYEDVPPKIAIKDLMLREQKYEEAFSD